MAAGMKWLLVVGLVLVVGAQAAVKLPAFVAEATPFVVFPATSLDQLPLFEMNNVQRIVLGDFLDYPAYPFVDSELFKTGDSMYMVQHFFDQTAHPNRARSLMDMCNVNAELASGGAPVCGCVGVGPMDDNRPAPESTDTVNHVFRVFFEDCGNPFRPNNGKTGRVTDVAGLLPVVEAMAQYYAAVDAFAQNCIKMTTVSPNHLLQDSTGRIRYLEMGLPEVDKQCKGENPLVVKMLSGGYTSFVSHDAKPFYKPFFAHKIGSIDLALGNYLPALAAHEFATGASFFLWLMYLTHSLTIGSTIGGIVESIGQLKLSFPTFPEMMALLPLLYRLVDVKQPTLGHLSTMPTPGACVRFLRGLARTMHWDLPDLFDSPSLDDANLNEPNEVVALQYIGRVFQPVYFELLKPTAAKRAKNGFIKFFSGKEATMTDLPQRADLQGRVQVVGEYLALTSSSGIHTIQPLAHYKKLAEHGNSVFLSPVFRQTKSHGITRKTKGEQLEITFTSPEDRQAFVSNWHGKGSVVPTTGAIAEDAIAEDAIAKVPVALDADVSDGSPRSFGLGSNLDSSKDVSESTLNTPRLDSQEETDEDYEM